MLFSLPYELLENIFQFLDPFDFLAVQSIAEPYDFYSLYRHAKKYALLDNEKTAFILFHHQNFMLNLYVKSQPVPPNMCLDMLRIAPPILKMISLKGLTPNAKTLLALHECDLVPRHTTTREIYLLLALQARKGSLSENLPHDEEIDIAIGLVRYGRHYCANPLLKKYTPQTVPMIKCMLHFGLELNVPNHFLTPDLCLYWFARTPCESQRWLVNHLPPNFDFRPLLLINPFRFLALATFYTLNKYQIIDRRVEWTHESSFFFPALFTNRKKCLLPIASLTPLSNIHIALHGKIAHLITPNQILLRSQFFYPPLTILEQGARHGDFFFQHHIGRLHGLSSAQVRYLRTLSIHSQGNQATLPLLPYLFSDLPLLPLISRQAALELTYNTGQVHFATFI